MSTKGDSNWPTCKRHWCDLPVSPNMKTGKPTTLCNTRECWNRYDREAAKKRADGDDYVPLDNRSEKRRVERAEKKAKEAAEKLAQAKEEEAAFNEAEYQKTIDSMEKRKAELQATVDAKEKKRIDDYYAKREILETEIVKGLERAPVWTPKRYIKPPREGYQHPEEVAVLLVGDWHAGELVRNEETGGISDFSTEKLAMEIQILVESMAEIAILQSSIPRKRLVILWGGDIITNQMIFESQKSYIDLCTVDQFIEVKRIAMEMLMNLCDLFEEVVNVGVVGNHGRTEKRKEQAPTWNNWDYLFYDVMKDKCEGYNNISWYYPKSWFALVNILGWKFLMQHGDTIRMAQRIPYFNMERDFNAMTAMLSQVEKSFYYDVYYHFHFAERAEVMGGERLVNGSPVGGSLFANKDMKANSRPSQTFFSVSRRRGITWLYNVYLDGHGIEPREIAPESYIDIDRRQSEAPTTGTRANGNQNEEASA